ncbi:MAG: translocation/assembly module TamB domain-containing protein [Sulfuricella denitrificans]|nr:translocation/assembly module TamB domain-containing protein [Sulfuricella denitrificans]
MINDQPPPATLSKIPARPRRKWLALLFALITLSAGAAWLVTTSSGLQWLAAMASRSSGGTLDLQGTSGALLGPMSAKALRLNEGDMHITVKDIRLDWRPAALLKGRLEIISLTAQNIEVLSPKSDKPMVQPNDLRLPLPLSLNKIEIGSLQIIRQADGTPEFAATRLAARLDSNGRQHRLQELRARIEYGELSASGQIDGSRPFALQARADLAGHESPQARITASASGRLEQFTLKGQGNGAGLSGQGEAQLRPFAAFPLTALTLTAKGLDPRAFSATAPQANLSLKVELRQNTAGKLEGSITATNVSPKPLDQGGLPLHEISARATISADKVQFDALTLTLSGEGRVDGRFAWMAEQATGSANLKISHLDPATLDTRLRPARLDGSATLSGDAQAQRGLISLGDGMLRLDANLTHNGDTLNLEHLRLARGKAALTGQGKLELIEKRLFAFEGDLQHFDLSAFLQAPKSDLNARFELDGERTPLLNGTLNFKIANSHLAGRPVSGGGQFGFSGLDRVRGEASLRLGDNHLDVRGAYGTPGERLELRLAAPALEQFEPGLGGTLTAQATLAGSPLKPEITFEMKGSRLTLPGDHHLNSLSASAGMHGEAINFNMEAAGYQEKAEILLQKLTLSIRGSRSRHEVNIQTSLANNAVLNLHASGGLTDPAQVWRNLQWRGVVSEFKATGQIPFHLITAAPVTLGRERISLGKAELAVAGGRAQFTSTEWTLQSWNSRGSFNAIGLRPSGLANGVQNALRLAGEWEISAAPGLAGKLRIRRESGDWILPGEQPFPLGLQELQLDAQVTGNRLSAELKAQGARFGNWRGNIALPLAQSGSSWSVLPGAPLSGKINIDVADLSWIGPVLDSNYKSGGRLVLNADVAGTYGQPYLRGQISGSELNVALLDQGIRLQQGKLAARLDQTRLYIDQMSFITPHVPPPRDRLLTGLKLENKPGSITLSGMIEPLVKRGSLDLSASRLTLAQRLDRWIIASGQGHIKFEQDTLTLGGNITADAGLISQPTSGRPQLSDDVVIIGRKVPIRQGPRIAVDAILDMGDQFYLRASGLEARLAGQLHLRSTSDQPLRASGTIATHNATFQAYGQNLSVERGIVNFQGPVDNPGLNVLALRKSLPVEAGVTVTGTVRRPIVRLVSTPNVTDPEKLSWIVLGRAPEAGGTDSTLLLSAAGSILGGQSGSITGQLAQALGLDELSLNQAQNGDPLAGQIVTVGKRLSARAFLSYEQGLTAVAGTTKLTYTLTPSISIVTRAGYDNAIDVLYTFHFD